MKLALLLVAFAFPAAAQQADAGVDDLQREREKAIQSDQSAAQKQGQQGAPAPPAAVTQSTGGAPQNLSRGSQSLNPDISAIVDADLGALRRAPQFLSGDDPDLHAEGTRHALGAAVQEVELALSATPPSRPWNLQVKAGSFRSAFGRQNGQHLHVQDFTRRPLINAAFLGA